MTELFNFLMIAGALQGFLFVFGTFLSRKKIEKPVLFLNLFVLFLSLNNLQSWLIDKDFIPFNYYTLPFYVLLAPMFHAFLIYYLGIEKKRSPFFKLTATVFLLELLTRTIFFYTIHDNLIGSKGYFELYNAIEDAVTLCFSLFIFYRVLKVLFRFQKLYHEILSFDDLKWIKSLIQLGGVILFLWGVAVFLNFVSESIKAPFSYYPLRLATSVYIYWIGYQGFFRYVVLQDRIGLRNEIRKPIGKNKVSSLLNSKNVERNEKEGTKFKNLDTFIRSNQKFLDPYLSLEQLCEELGTSSSSLSKLVNSHAGENFADYINRLRVEEAKRLLSESEFSSYTIVAIGLECGFNSKSTFYAAFKKFTGQTPTQFRSSPS